LTVAAAAAGIVVLFNVVSAGGSDDHRPMVAAAATAMAPLPRPAVQPWGVEFEAEMRRDITALAGFIVNDVAPVVEVQKDTAPVLALARGYQQRLSGCAGPAGMADHALALNDLLAQSHVLFTALEVLAEREENIPTGPDSQARLEAYKALSEKFENNYSRAARWLWDINNAVAAAHPEMEERIEALREAGKFEGDLHRKAEGDSYATGYPLTNTTPLRGAALILAPYAKGPMKPNVACP
jgi:hypothetical protein